MSAEAKTVIEHAADDDEFGLNPKPNRMDTLFAAMRVLTESPEFKAAGNAARAAGVELTVNLTVKTSEGLLRASKPG